MASIVVASVEVRMVDETSFVVDIQLARRIGAVFVFDVFKKVIKDQRPQAENAKE